jgi:hypothetical protein
MPSFFQNLFKKDADEYTVGVPVAPSDRLAEPPSFLSAMNLSSPFAAAAAGEQFTIRELTMLLPPQFLRTDSMPGDQPVALPLDVLRHSLEQGRPALRLSQIYQACPFLFSRQIQPSEDLEIVLPWQKVKRMVDGGQAPGSPFAAVAPPGARMESPFAASASPFMPAAGTPAASPFAARAPEPVAHSEVLSPFAAEGLPPLEPALPALASNPFQRLEAPPEPPRAASPFQLVAPAPEPPAPSPPSGASPFAQEANGNGIYAKVRTAPSPVAPLAPAPANPFESAPTPAPLEVPVSQLRATPATAPAESAPAPAPATAPVAESLASLELPQRITVMLSTMLRGVTADDLGFDPTAVPDHVEAELALDSILPQLASGKVEVGVEELRDGVVDRFRPAFARCRSGLRFVVPLSEIFKSLPESAIPAPKAPPVPHIPIITSPFQTPFALKAAEDEARGAQPALPPLLAPAPPVPVATLPAFPVPPALSSSPTPQTAPITLPSTPPSSVHHEPASPSPAPAMTSPPPSSPGPAAPSRLPGMPALPKLPNLTNLSGKPSPFSRPPGMSPAGEAVAPAGPFSAPATLPSAPGTETHEDLGQPFSAGSLRAEPPAGAPPSLEPFNPAKLFADASPPPPPSASPLPFPRPAPVLVAPAAPARPVTAPVPAAPPIEFNFGETPDMARVIMRAIFDTDQDLTQQEIVDHIARLPGLKSALAIINGSVIASSPGSDSDEITQFTASAPKSCEYLGGLAESMGYGSSGSFTLRAGTGVRTIFLEKGHCLAVLHATSAFAPGVRDKLLVTARTLGDLVD